MSIKLKLFTVSMALIATILTSCKKDKVEITPLASIQITNAVTGGSTLQFGTNATTIVNNAYTAYGILTGNQTIKLRSANIPNTVYYNQTKELINGGVYSLFLAGTPTAVESVFLKEENIPFHHSDVFGARVIHLSPGSAPISVNLKGSPSGSFISNLSYKAISTFKEVSSVASESTKTFEFRNAVTGDLISIFDVQDYDLPRFRNITLVFAGATGSEVTFRLNNY